MSLRGWTGWLGVAVIACGAAGRVCAQTEEAKGTGQPSPSVAPAPVPSIVPTPATVPDLAARLTALRPDDPAAYFRLGEEVADEATDAGAKDLARTLFVLAYELDLRRGGAAANLGAGRESGAVTALGPSACLALAAVADTDEERRWLTALAGALDDSASEDAAAAGAGLGPTAREVYALDLANVLGLARAGKGREAERLLSKPGVSQLLDRYERLLSPVGLTGGASRVRKLVQDWPVCSECRNRRAVRTLEGVRTCPTCQGKPGPRLTLSDVIYQLRLESTLLSGAHRSWAAQIIVDGGAPLRDLDPAELAATYRVDPARCVWRNGVWVVPEGAAGSPAGAKAPEAQPKAKEPEPVAPSGGGAAAPSRSS